MQTLDDALMTPGEVAYGYFQGELGDIAFLTENHEGACSGTSNGLNIEGTLLPSELRRIADHLNPPQPIGFLFYNPDTGFEFSKNHPVDSGEVPDAECIRPAMAEVLLDALMAAWKFEAEEAEIRAAAPVIPEGFALVPINLPHTIEGQIQHALWNRYPAERITAQWGFALDVWKHSVSLAAVSHLHTEAEVRAEVDAELAETRASFDLRWKADMRAVERWRAAQPGRELRMPDHADLCVWLLDQLEVARHGALEEAIQAVKALNHRDDHTHHPSWMEGNVDARYAIRDLIDRPAPVAVGSYLGSDDSDCGNG